MRDPHSLLAGVSETNIPLHKNVCRQHEPLGGVSYIKRSGTVVVSLRGINHPRILQGPVSRKSRNAFASGKP